MWLFLNLHATCNPKDSLISKTPLWSIGFSFVNKISILVMTQVEILESVFVPLVSSYPIHNHIVVTTICTFDTNLIKSGILYTSTLLQSIIVTNLHYQWCNSSFHVALLMFVNRSLYFPY